MDDGAVARLVEEAKQIRRLGRLDEAAGLLAAEGDLADGRVGLNYISWMVERDEPAALQEALRQSARRLMGAGAPPDPAHLALASRQAEFCCLETDLLEGLLALSADAQTDDEQIQRGRQGLRRRISFRRQALPRWRGHATLISLGLNCMPWDLLNTWGFRRPDEYVSLYTPFAHAVHRCKAVLGALATDFDGYCRPEQLTPVETPGGYTVPGRADAQVFWNHHRGAYWTEDGFGRLLQNMAWKIEAFRSACRHEDAVFLMGKAPVRFPDEPIGFLDDLNARLEPFTGRARNRIMFWDEFSDENARHVADDWTIVLNCPMPGAGGTWYDPDADDGMAFEKLCATAVLASLSDWGLMRRAEDADAGVSEALA
jgi:hypothetical protein